MLNSNVIFAYRSLINKLMVLQIFKRHGYNAKTTTNTDTQKLCSLLLRDFFKGKSFAVFIKTFYC